MKMRKMMIVLVVTLAFLLAACAAGGVESEPTLESGGVTDEAPALNPATPDTDANYPAPGPASDEYPAPSGSELPDGYPELDVVPPSGTVDLGSLTPEAGENTTPQVAPAPGRPGGIGSPQLGVLMEAVRMNLSSEMAVPLDEVIVVSTEPVTWPNAALGCPQEGMAYAEVIVEGSIITLEAAGQQYTYHTGGTSSFVLCQDGEPISSGVVPR
jgi:hypothetical protein